MRGEGTVVPRKRQRTQKQPAQRKRSRLNFNGLPTELFTIIASYLLPPDILSLARVNKFFHGILMWKASRNIWSTAIENAEGLPTCPRDMSEPRYVALLFTNVCSSCGTTTKNAVDEFLLVRLCGACNHDDLIRLHQVPEVLHELVYYSTKGFDVCDLLPELEMWRKVGIAVRDEVNAVCDKYNELAEDDDVDQFDFDTWIEYRKRCFAGELDEFLFKLQLKRCDEKKELANKRQAQIEERLLALGWEQGDLKCNPCSGGRARAWYELVEMPKQPKLLTDRTWKNLYVKLHPLLEANREERLALKAAQLNVTYLTYLDTFLDRIKRKEPPLLRVKPRQPGSKTIISSSPPLTCRDVFPFPQDALEWSCIQALVKEEPDAKAFQRGLEKNRTKIDGEIAKWRDTARTYLVDLINEEDMEYPEFLQPPNNMDSRNFTRLSDDQKLLLRADSLFYIGDVDSTTILCRPLPYDKALRNIYLNCPEYPEELWEMDRYWEPEVPDLDSICRYDAAQKVARDLLDDLGKPNASYLEVNQLRYTCQRCHNKEPMDWPGIIKHFLEQRQIFAKVKKHASTLAQEGIEYNNVHEPGSKPMIKPSKPKTSVKVAVRTCSWCVRHPIGQNVTASKTNLYKHLLEVHGVKKPDLNTHYHVPDAPKRWDKPGVGYEYLEEEGGEIEEVEADNKPKVKGDEREYVYEGKEPWEDDGDENQGYLLNDGIIDWAKLK